MTPDLFSMHTSFPFSESLLIESHCVTESVLSYVKDWVQIFTVLPLTYDLVTSLSLVFHICQKVMMELISGILPVLKNLFFFFSTVLPPSLPFSSNSTLTALFLVCSLSSPWSLSSCQFIQWCGVNASKTWFCYVIFVQVGKHSSWLTE